MTMWTRVSKDDFFATVGKLNVHPRSERDCTFWETPRREVLGMTTPGYMGSTARTYAISESLAQANGLTHQH